MKRVIDLLRMTVPLGRDAHMMLEGLDGYLDADEIKELRVLLKQKKVTYEMQDLGVSQQMYPHQPSYPVFSTEHEEIDIARINKKLVDNLYKSVFAKFSVVAGIKIPKYIGIGIVGYEAIKVCCALQLFASEPFHILLLGDPGTGKTVIIREASGLHPIHAFGLGSGTSGAGLTVTVKGKEISKGLLAMADRGICAIDELNLMDFKDRASLYNAMEKGFFTYDKGGVHERFDARIRVLATANPKGDKFVGFIAETLRKQMPFDPALLTRFHMVFLIRKPDLEAFKEISKSIIKGKKKDIGNDGLFIQKYVEHCSQLEVELPEKFTQQIVDAVEDVKKNEKKYLIEISPRIVVGITRMAKAAARMRMDTVVNQEDIDLALRILKLSLEIKGEKE